MTVVKTELKNIVRDTESGALLNNDNSALLAYKAQKKKASELDELKQRVNNIENQFANVNNLLNKILEKL